MTRMRAAPQEQSAGAKSNRGDATQKPPPSVTKGACDQGRAGALGAGSGGTSKPPAASPLASWLLRPWRRLKALARSAISACSVSHVRGDGPPGPT